MKSQPVEEKCICEDEREFYLCSSLRARIVRGCVLQVEYQAYSNDSSLFFDEEEAHLNFCPQCGRKLEYKEMTDDEDNRRHDF
jgi:hypothetical protein